MKMEIRGRKIDDLARLAVQSNLLDEYRVGDDVVELFCDEQSFRLSRLESSVFLIGMLTADSRRERLHGHRTRQISDDAAVIWDDSHERRPHDDGDERRPQGGRTEELPHFRMAILKKLLADGERKGVIRGHSLDLSNDSVRIYLETSACDMKVAEATRFLRGALAAYEPDGGYPKLNRPNRKRERQSAISRPYADGHGGVWLL